MAASKSPGDQPRRGGREQDDREGEAEGEVEEEEDEARGGGANEERLLAENELTRVWPARSEGRECPKGPAGETLGSVGGDIETRVGSERTERRVEDCGGRWRVAAG